MSDKPKVNFPCPCGSGKKYKKCCGAPVPSPITVDPKIVTGDRAAELQAFQILALAIREAADRVGNKLSDEATTEAPPLLLVVPALLMAASRALLLASVAGLDTPIEVLALSARNVFELRLRLMHILASEANCLSWRNEALTDQMQVYEAIFSLGGTKKPLPEFLDEVERAKRHGGARGLTAGQRPLMAGDLAKATGHKDEYDAFYRLYSKLVHPSSWLVNWPGAVSSEMYHYTLSLNAQIYGWNILKAVNDKFGVSPNDCYQAAVARFRDLRNPAPIQ